MNNKKNTILRSCLFVPGNKPVIIDKALKSKADAVIIDLEDAVPLSDKQQTPTIVRDKIIDTPQRYIIVRVNDLGSKLTPGDLSAIVSIDLNGIMLPKVQRKQDVLEIDKLLSEYEQKASLPVCSIALFSLIETALGVENAYTISSAMLPSGRDHCLAFGAADFTLDMGVSLTRGGEELAFARSRIAIASKAAGLPSPIDSPFMTDLKNQELLIEDIIRGKKLGFGGKLCIHPNQVDPCNVHFSPSHEEIIFSQKIVEAFQEASEKGTGSIEVDGKMVDLPIVQRSSRILEFAEQLKII